MLEGLAGLLVKAEYALSCCEGVVEKPGLNLVAERIHGVETRSAYPDDMIVVCLAGGTGSGKSSLFNALVGADVADIGGVRPTTSVPLAVVGLGRLKLVGGYLDRLGIHALEVDGAKSWLCLIDLPDTDSVVVDHRHRVEELLPTADLVIWVTDPEKYRDDALHNRYIAPLSSQSDRFLFALNQIDRLPGDGLQRVLADLRKALSDDGVRDARVFPTSAAPAAGPPSGTDVLLDALESIHSSGSSVMLKLLADLEESANRLLDSTGGKSVDFESRAEEVLLAAVDKLSTGAMDDASDVITQFLERLASEVGGPTSRQIGDIATTVPSLISTLTPPPVLPEPRRWFQRGKDRQPTKSDEGMEGARGRLEDKLVDPVRLLLRKRAVANAALTDLTISIVSAERSLRK
ncbi:MAG: GTPase [Acidimicrobiia bacterium]